MKNGMDFLRDPARTPEELADILWKGHPPFTEPKKTPCCHTTCRECWLAWLTTGKPPIPKEGGKG